MNNLKTLEFELVRHIDKELPLFSEKKIKIPYSYQQMPKDILELSERIDNSFLNGYQHMIEEIYHRDNKNKIVNDLSSYQSKYFKGRGILKGDGFYNKRIGYYRHVMPSALSIKGASKGNPFLTFGHVNGADLTTGGTSNHSGPSDGFLEVYQVSTGVIGQFYNQVAINVFSAAGNHRLAVYTDSGGAAANLYKQSSDVAAANGYNFLSLTEFALTTTANWAAVQVTNAAIQCYYTPGTRNYQTFSYASFPSSAGSFTTDSAAAYNMKVGHS